MDSFYHYSPIEKENMRVVPLIEKGENGQPQIYLWESGMPYLIGTIKIEGILLDGEVAINDFDYGKGILDSMISAKIIEPPHRYVLENDLEIPICKLLVEIPEKL
jgi:hypothetical protein